MNGGKSIFMLGLSLIFLGTNHLPVFAEINIAQTIRSVSEVKNKIRDYIKVSTDAEVCAGACVVTRKLGICSLVEDLDIQVGGKISGRVPQRKKPLLRISKSDLRIMQLIYQECETVATEELPPYIQIKPGEQYKMFSPSAQSLREIKRRLGIN